MNQLYLLIKDQFQEASLEVKKYNQCDSIFKQRNPVDPIEVDGNTMLLAICVEKAYSLMEKSLHALVSDIDQEKITGESWHKKLLLTT